MASAKFKTSTALPYLKVNVSSEDDDSVIQLAREDSPVITELGSGLLVMYVADTGDELEFIQMRDLDESSVSQADLHETAINNFISHAAEKGLQVAPHGNIFAVLLDGNFEASVLLLDQVWDDSLRQFVEGEYLVAFPARDILAFCDRSSEDGRMELNELIRRLEHGADHPLEKRLFVRVDHKWIPDDAS